MTRQRLAGWGRTAPVVADVVTPTSEDEVLSILAREPAVLARGLGRSYGDAAQVAGGVVIDNTGFSTMAPVDPTGSVRLGAGVSIDELLRVIMPQGYFVPVTPGTRQVTMGGAVGADVHGKGHHVDGSFGRYVSAMRLATPTGLRVLTAADDPALFWATVGGMGLTGVITEITLDLLPIETDQVLVDTDRFDNLDDVMAAMVDGDAGYRFSVAWVDCMAEGATMGRSILERGNLAQRGTVDKATLDPPHAARLMVPFNSPGGLLNALSIKAFNEVWFRRAPRHERDAPRALTTFFHPLDGVRDWNRLYGRRGFVQYQFVVPDDAADVVRRAIQRLSSSGMPSFFAVLKRFGPGDPGPLSFPIPGWTLALDIPVGPPELPGVLDALDHEVLDAGGRVYLAKDARLDAGTFAAMYPQLHEFRRVKETVDPHGVLTSDLARRLNINGK